MILSHEHAGYQRLWQYGDANRFNGAYYYSVEICENIIPNVKTERSWITINYNPEVRRRALNGAVTFIHNNLNTKSYEWLRAYRDLILVCGIPETCDKVKHLGTPVYLPLSVDVPYVEQFKTAKTKGTAYCGRPHKLGADRLRAQGVDMLEGMPREELLAAMAQYEKVYAVGRCAIEAKVLGCEVLPYDERYPDPSIWWVVDNHEAAAMLQELLDEIDGRQS